MNKTIFLFGCLLAAILTFCIMFVDILVPFILAFVLAYLLNPLILPIIKKFNCNKSPLIFCIVSLLYVLVMILLVFLLPLISQELTAFIKKFPLYKETVEQIIMAFADQLHSIDHRIPAQLMKLFHIISNNLLGVFYSVAQNVWQYTLATMHFFMIIFLTPIILYYLLVEWDSIQNTIRSFVPKTLHEPFNKLILDLDHLMSGYLRGQLNLCSIVMCYYTICLGVLGIELSLLIGIVSGILILIPFVGAMISYIIMMISCYLTFGYGTELLYVTLFFCFGHAIEGYILVPKIIGKKIGLHPLWILLAVLVAGSVWGLMGVIIAIPIAGIAKIISSYLIAYYKTLYDL